MTLKNTDVEKIAHLARLAISAEEIPEYGAKISKTLELISQMNNLNTQAITPMAHPLEGLTQRLREDKVTEENQRDLFQTLTPHVQAGYYLVPEVITKE